MKSMLKLKGKSYIMDWINERKQGNGMSNQNQSAPRRIISILTLAAMSVMVSCSGKSEETEGTFLSFGKDGSVQSYIVENFVPVDAQENYYDEAELQQSILSQAASYNRNTGNESITVEKVEAKDDVVIVQMTYAGPEDYASFNKAVLFVGEASKAAGEGYELNVVLSSIKDADETMGKPDILAMKDARILITDINDAIVLNGKALYVSDNVTVSGNAKTVIRSAEDDGLAYIIFK